MKDSVRMEFEHSKKLLKMRGIIYYKRINIFATNILALRAMIDPNMSQIQSDSWRKHGNRKGRNHNAH